MNILHFNSLQFSRHEWSVAPLTASIHVYYCHRGATRRVSTEKTKMLANEAKGSTNRGLQA